MNIVVLCGGLSAERDVSISSGLGVTRALREMGHNVVFMDLYFGYKDSYNYPLEVFEKATTDFNFSVGEEAPDLDAVKKMSNGNGDCIIGKNVCEICAVADITFLALHGEEGENGKIQAYFDIHGIKYTGCGYLGSALAMNKELSKILLSNGGVNVPQGITITKGKLPYENVGFPCVVKPCSGGSSVGTYIVECANDYEKFVEKAFEAEEKLIVEQYIKAREFTVGVIEGVAMPVVEIIPKCGFYDYKNKYQAGLTVEICPAEISEKDTQRLQETAENVYKLLKIDAYCRADFLMDESGKIYCLEANTLPGMTPTSLIPQMAEAMGMSYGQLCERIIEVSEARYK